MICGGNCKDAGQVCDEMSYTDAEYEFGKENLATFPAAFTKRIKKLIANIEKYLKQPALQQASKEELLQRKQRLEGVLNGEVK